MPPRRPTRPAPPDVDVLRANLGQGKIVRVGLAPSDQFPDGVTGRVRRIGDPVVDGDEFVFVEVPVGGAKDVLPFAVSDLLASPARAKAAATARPSSRTAPATAPTGKLTTAPKATNAATSGRTTPTARPTSAAPPMPAAVSPRTLQKSSGSPTGAAPRTAPTSPSGIGVASPASFSSRMGSASADAPPVDSLLGPPTTDRSSRTPRRNPARAARGKRAPVTITITTSGDESAVWSIDARIGAKAVVRPTAIPLTRVWELVQSLGEPQLSDLVRALLDEHRHSTQVRADALATQLSALQAELRSFPADSGRPAARPT